MPTRVSGASADLLSQRGVVDEVGEHVRRILVRFDGTLGLISVISCQNAFDALLIFHVELEHASVALCLHVDIVSLEACLPLNILSAQLSIRWPDFNQVCFALFWQYLLTGW